jgi:hypothetical protein
MRLARAEDHITLLTDERAAGQIAHQIRLTLSPTASEILKDPHWRLCQHLVLACFASRRKTDATKMHGP